MPKNIPVRFRDEAAARRHLEALQWPDGPVCPHCGVLDRASAISGGRKGLWFCNACRSQYSVTVGTVFERSKVPLHTWLYANHLLCSSKKGISSHQLARMLGVTYKTAWFMAHRIREAMAPVEGQQGPLGGEGKIVEADETFTGQRDGTTWMEKRGGRHKIAVLALVERKGKVRSFKLGGHPSKEEIQNIVRANVDRKTHVMTDEARHYHSDLGMKHSTVHHASGEYVRGSVSTNTVEGVFSVFKRGMIGTYQHCGEQHLQRYLNEFDFRYNNRVALGIGDEGRADNALKGIVGKRLTYRRTDKAAHA